MGRLQDFNTVTPASTDNILIVQSTGQGLATVGSTLGAKMDKANPTGIGSLSLNRKSGTTTGNYSTAEGFSCTASNTASHAEGSQTTASGLRSHAEGESTTSSGDRSHAEGNSCVASGLESHAEGNGTTASGVRSHAEGRATIANHRSQHVFGEFNTADTSTAQADARGNYVEIVGKGADDAHRSNARTLDWSGNEVLAGGLKLHNNQNAATLSTLEPINNGGGTLDCSSYAEGAIIFLYRPSASKVGIYVKADTWARVIPILPISTVSVNGYVITNNDASESLRGTVIST